MGLFDIFKAKKENEAGDTNTDQLMVNTDELNLDELLEIAVKEPVYKPAFYKRVLTDEIIVISINVNVSDGYQYLEVGTSVELYALADGTIPLFTTIDRIFDHGVVKDDVEFLKMSGADLFSVAQGEKFIVNPHSDYKVKISPGIVQNLLDGRI
ncbi:SseB protein N-terminal domain-containing protein [Pedobacter westerhofensis]|uniref:SseB protein N-terminal domain-containing protein n=1 Tax=Pedobacter westerhofensis TaxID=425512 RepID=A0A521D169_9SPHI|nr:SseB family protein [Pedobacter westerhofensis]SMO64650.1 SseB protein N-terminal domain-containing protein [Pedobacter westerhofensis]